MTDHHDQCPCGAIIKRDDRAWCDPATGAIACCSQHLQWSIEDRQRQESRDFLDSLEAKHRHDGMVAVLLTIAIWAMLLFGAIAVGVFA